MASSSKRPADIGGYGGQIQMGVPDLTRGGLIGREFTSVARPDVQPYTRIVAPCGVTDYSGDHGCSVSSDDDDEALSVGTPPIKSHTGTFSILATMTKDLFSAKKRK